MSRQKFVFTVFTPTYNRADTIHRVYESLCLQIYRSFEWIVVDDASTDQTASLIAEFSKRENFFPIRYFRLDDNRHKKYAHNFALRKAKGIFFLPADSDDAFPPNALLILRDLWKTIPKELRIYYSGVTGLCADPHGNVVGDRFPENIWDSNPAECHFKYRITGEKWGFHRTEVLRRFPFEENIPGYVPEGSVWIRLSRDYRVRFANQIVRTYIPASSSDGTTVAARSSIHSAPGFLYFSKLILETQLHYFGVNPWPFIISAARVTRLKLLIYLFVNARFSWYREPWLPRGAPARFFVIVMSPCGLLWFLKDVARLVLVRSADADNPL